MTTRTDDHPLGLENDIRNFLIERQIRRVTPSTLRWHRNCLHRFAQYCYAIGIFSTNQINAQLLRRFVFDLELDHNPGGVANIWRSIKAFLNWCETEYEDTGWRNPVRRVRVADNQSEPLDPISLNDFRALLNTCERKTLAGERDRALLLMLIDTGIRKSEITALAVSDINLESGSVLIRSGKGGKPRTVFIGSTTRRTLSAYLRMRQALLTYMAKPTETLWINSRNGAGINQSGIRQIVRRRAKDACVPEPSMHAFRRAFAINSLRNGMSVLALQRLLGHSSLTIINRYVKLLDDDLAQAHHAHGVVDNL